MAEGFEESETNNNSNNCEGAVMIGTVMPSLASSLNFGSIKKELESACVTSKIHLSPSSDNDDRNRHSPEPQKRNVKEENNDDDDRSNASTPQSQRHTPEPKEHHIFNEHYQNSDKSSLSSSKNNSNSSQMSSLNGTMQDLINLQKLQNLSIFQHPQLSQQLPGLSNLAGGGQNLLNSPLNLSLAGHSNIPAGGEGALSPQLPQLILASGQLIQGIQGAQLLIPTSQGVTTQTILTIPVSQQIASSVTKEQIFQNITQLISRADNLSSPLPPHLPLSQSQIINSSNLLNTHFLSNNAQQLLSSIQPPNILPTLAAAAAAQQQAQSQHEHQQSQQSKSSLVSKSSQHLSSSRHSPLTSNQSKLNHHHHRDHNRPKSHSPQPTNLSNNLSSMFDVKASGGAARLTPIAERSNEVDRDEHRKSSPLHSHQNSSRDSHSPNFSNRLPTTNGELIITKSHPHHLSSGNAGPSRSSQSSPQSGHHNLSNYHLPSSMAKSPTNSSSHKPPLSPAGSDNSGGDLLSDSPNELTINQTNCNVVDGIDLDEIKEFAKAFKLRRLSLGLTQTQVGQALSVTEGPAYSQSAICSALAAQMYAAAQISSQQQMFEKLDITPKSAQKIKPVLEKWMKEAEERYKTGQNHLTDFIGVEPSKKRKRRTSFTPQALELLNAHFERNTHPSGTEITGLAHQLGYEREVIRIWFCNKRQALKNTVRMMSKGMV